MTVKHTPFTSPNQTHFTWILSNKNSKTKLKIMENFIKFRLEGYFYIIIDYCMLLFQPQKDYAKIQSTPKSEKLRKPIFSDMNPNNSYILYKLNSRYIQPAQNSSWK